MVGDEAIVREIAPISRDFADDEFQKRNATYSAYKRLISDVLRNRDVPTLGQLIARSQCKPNQVFTHYSDFYFRGLAEARNNSGGNGPAPAVAHIALDGVGDPRRLICRFHPDHLTSNSAWSELSGHKRMMVFGLITDVTETEVQALPYVIANPAPGLLDGNSSAGFWINKLEIHPVQVDQFSKVGDAPLRLHERDLQILKDIPENEVKHAFADLLGEPEVQKDWGGERSDLFSTRVTIQGSPYSTAFAFKGPAKFKKMTLASLGKNGDQIDRLFTEPADLLVLQHCHSIDTAVRGTMRAYANQLNDPRLYMIIDGYDTIRILNAYSRCGVDFSNR